MFDLIRERAKGLAVSAVRGMTAATSSPQPHTTSGAGCMLRDEIARDMPFRFAGIPARFRRQAIDSSGVRGIFQSAQEEIVSFQI